MIQHLLDENRITQLRNLLNDAQHIVVTCHVSPDGDAIGSMLAMTHYLLRNGKQVTSVAPNYYPDFLRWMPGTERVLCYEHNEEQVDALLATADLFICLDFNAAHRMEMLTPAVMNHPAPKVMIDHHLEPEDFAVLTFSSPVMSSTCELLFSILIRLDGIDALTQEEAVCLYTGMMTDTGGFTYNSNRSDIYHIIAQLLDKGIDKDKIYRNIYYTYSADRFRLMGYMLYVKMEVFHAYHAALITLDRAEQRRFCNKKGDTEGFVNIPLQISGMKLSVFLRENTEKDTVRVSLRSVDDFPCNQMAAEFFNGGGHLNASGGELACSMDEAVAVVKQALKKYAPLLK